MVIDFPKYEIDAMKDVGLVADKLHVYKVVILSICAKSKKVRNSLNQSVNDTVAHTGMNRIGIEY